VTSERPEFRDSLFIEVSSKAIVDPPTIKWTVSTLVELVDSVH
jgi:hypothetical protein